MAARDVIYDLTRLASRFSRSTPNGIDRVDLGYAQHFLSAARGARGAIFGPIGVRAVDNLAGRAIADAVAEHWRETGRAEDDPVYRRIVARLDGASEQASGATAPARAAASAGRSIAKLLSRGRILGRAGLFPARSLVRTAPKGAIYLHTSQFPLWLDGYFRWLDRRPDVKAVFFLHDLLPITYPEFFPPSEAQRHEGRLRVLARRGAGVIVSSDYTREALAKHLRDRGEAVPPIRVLPLPVSEVFASREVAAPVLAQRDYFMTVGTIEPRKNQLMLLNIWRELVERFGKRTPLLLLVGARGWDNENVVDMLERCRAIGPYVAEVTHLSTPALRRLMAGTRALLMPTLAEGYGLPVAEARAVGVPLIVSNIPGLGVATESRALALDPTDGPAWRDAIIAHFSGSKTGEDARTAVADRPDTRWAWHMEHVEEFLQAL